MKKKDLNEVIKEAIELIKGKEKSKEAHELTLSDTRRTTPM